jgi:hypothetical protein
MASHNTGSDSANTNVRAFLTKIGKYYLGKSFNHTSGNAKRLWEKIVHITFCSECAYCGIKNSDSKLTMEHLIPFNRTECGLHHPGNVVPCCNPCQKRPKDADGNFVKWEKHLETICQNKKVAEKRKHKIKDHVEDQNYPNLTKDEMAALKAITNHLYSSTQTELDKAEKLFTQINETLVNKSEIVDEEKPGSTE